MALLNDFLQELRRWRRRYSTEILRLEKERFDILVQTVEDYAIFALDTAGHVKSWNAGAERIKGYKAKEILGKHFSIFYPENLKQTNFPEQELAMARLHGRFVDEGYRIRKDGTSFWANVTITVIYGAHGEVTGFLKVTRDMTEIKNAQEALRKLNEDLEHRVRERTAALYERELELKQAKEVAEAANEAKSTFLANMSHEIRTPLGAILGFSDLLADEQISPEERDQAREAIQRNGQILTDLINDVLDLSKVEANRLEIESNPVDLRQLAHEIQGAFKLRAESKNIDFSLDLDPHIPPRVRTDALRLKQILFNVIGNAIKFTRQGEVSLKISTRGDKLYFEVRDSGVGISENQMKNLFIPFQQADPSITREFGGTGLGLILSKRLAQALGGDLVLTSSEPGQGSTFTASIQLIAEQNSKELTSREGFEIQKELLGGKKILVVDDNPDNRLLISHLFRNYSVQIENAMDGVSGIQKALAWNPDFILMDLQMPLMGGVAAMEELRKKEFRNPIIALTAHALKEERERCLAKGFNAYITKPIDKSLLFATLAAYLD